LKPVSAFVTFALVALAIGHGAEVALTVMAPNEPVVAGREVRVDVVAINPGSLPAPWEIASSLSGRVTTADGAWAVELHAMTVNITAVAPDSFAVRSYAFTVPAGAVGKTIVEITRENGRYLRSAIDVVTAPSPGKAQPETPLRGLASSTRAIDAIINRTFAGRLTPNDPIYFIYGGGRNSAAKFQFSFNYRLATLHWGEEGHEQVLNLQLGYTQRSLWDIDASSSPFYDTSYMPELSVETLAVVPHDKHGWFTWVGWRSGVMHESNGRAGADSRSLNTIYVRPMFAIGSLDSWHLVVFPDFAAYLTDVNENEHLKDYRGYGRLRMVYGKNNGPSLLFAGWTGKDFNHPTYQLDLAYPIRTKLLGFESFVLLQYFNGFGESLVSYDKKSHALRVGLELLR
jgi:phospholipase A1